MSTSTPAATAAARRETTFQPSRAWASTIMGTTLSISQFEYFANIARVIATAAIRQSSAAAAGDGRDGREHGQRQEEHRRHIDHHQWHLGQEIGHAEQQYTGIQAEVSGPQCLADEVGQHHRAREQKAGENLHADPAFAEDLEDYSVDQRGQRQVCPCRDVVAPRREEIANPVELQVLGLHEVSCSVNDDLRFLPQTRRDEERCREEQRHRPAATQRQPRNPVCQRNTGHEHQEKREWRDAVKHPPPAGKAVVVQGAQVVQAEQRRQRAQRNQHHPERVFLPLQPKPARR